MGGESWSESVVGVESSGCVGHGGGGGGGPSVSETPPEMSDNSESAGEGPIVGSRGPGAATTFNLKLLGTVAVTSYR